MAGIILSSITIVVHLWNTLGWVHPLKWLALMATIPLAFTKKQTNMMVLILPLLTLRLFLCLALGVWYFFLRIFSLAIQRSHGQSALLGGLLLINGSFSTPLKYQRLPCIESVPPAGQRKCQKVSTDSAWSGKLDACFTSRSNNCGSGTIFLSVFVFRVAVWYGEWWFGHHQNQSTSSITILSFEYGYPWENFPAIGLSGYPHGPWSQLAAPPATLGLELFSEALGIIPTHLGRNDHSTKPKGKALFCVSS